MTSVRKIKHANDWRIPGQSLHFAILNSGMDALHSKFPQRPHEWYILRGRKPVPVSFGKMMRWAREQNGSGRMTVTIAKSRAGAHTVSTIFLGMNHGFMSPMPVLFETMAWTTATGKFRDEQYRAYTWEQAMEQHKQYAQRLRMQLVAK